MFCIHLGPVLGGTAVQGPEILYIIIQRISFILLIMYIPCETMLTHPTNFMDILCSTSEVSMICTNSSKEMRVSCKRHINVIPDPDLWNRFRSIWVQHQHRHLVGSGHIKKDIQFDLFVLSTNHTIKKDEQFLHSKESKSSSTWEWSISWTNFSAILHSSASSMLSTIIVSTASSSS